MSVASSSRRHPFGLGLVCLGWYAAVTSGCDSCRGRADPNPSSPAASRATEGTSPALSPLQASDAVTPIAVAGQPDAQLLVPLGVTTPQPLVALLFASVKGLAQACEANAKDIRTSAFVLCQPTVSAQQSLVSADAASDLVASALRANLRVVKARFNRYVSSGSMSLGGIGDAADTVAPIVRRNPEFFPRVALFDGGFREWTAVDSARFARAGGKAFCARCSTDSCQSEASRVVATLKALGVSTRLALETASAPSTIVAGKSSADPLRASDHGAEPSELLGWLLSREPSRADTARDSGNSRDAEARIVPTAAGSKPGNTVRQSRSKADLP